MAEIKDGYKVRTAHEVVAANGPITETLEDQAKRAEEAGVNDYVYADYEKALEAYEARPDVETLAERRAREGGASFHDAAFRRQIGAVDNAGLVATDTAVETENKKSAVTEEARTESPKKDTKGQK